MDGNDSIPKYCRICASNPAVVYNIFDVIYEEKLLSEILGQCLQCTVHRTECFPEYICSQCCADLLTMHKFIANYEKNEKWFISRYEALNDARIIKTETVCPTQFEKTFNISVEPNHQIFVESVINAIPIQDQTPNPLQVKEEFNHDYEFEMDDLPLSPNESALENQEPNEGNYNNVQENLAGLAYGYSTNEVRVRQATWNKEMIRHENKAGIYQCSMCPTQFSRLYRLREHENLHTGKIAFECYFCDEIFRRNDYCVRHIRKVHPDVAFECYTCKLTFNSYNQMRGHMRICVHMRIRDHSTSSQNEVYPVVEVPMKKKRNHAEIETGKHQCSMCPKQFSQLFRLREHENLHTGKITFECYFCDKIFRRSDYCVRHIQKVHPEVMQEDNNGHHENLHTSPQHICEVCGMFFSTKYRLMDHQLKHTDEKPYECMHQDCQKAYKRKSQLKEHLKTHEGKIDYFCECGKGFVLARTLKKHRGIHSTEQLQCPFCPKVFTQKGFLNQHIDRHGGKQYKCKYCELMLTSRSGRKQHQRNIHEAPKSYECFDCKRIFKYRVDLLQHMKIHSSNGRVIFECEICYKPFWSESQFICHKRKHNERVFNCEYCNESFEKRFNLNSHVREIHAEKIEQHQCDQCSKRFPLKSSLKTHIYNSHTGEKPNLCTECGRTFAAPSLLKSHLQRHSDERPISCSHCPSKFKNKLQLKNHMAVHSLERNFICQVVVDGERVCGKKFHTANRLSNHRKKHSPTYIYDRPFACLTCPAKFRKKDKLEVHTRIHTGERPFKCDHCQRTFTQKGDMKKHLLIHLGPTPHNCSECNASFRLVTELRKHSYKHYKPPTAE